METLRMGNLLGRIRANGIPAEFAHMGGNCFSLATGTCEADGNFSGVLVGPLSFGTHRGYLANMGELFIGPDNHEPDDSVEVPEDATEDEILEMILAAHWQTVGKD